MKGRNMSFLPVNPDNRNAPFDGILMSCTNLRYNKGFTQFPCDYPWRNAPSFRARPMSPATFNFPIIKAI